MDPEKKGDIILTYSVSPYTPGVFEEMQDSAKGKWKVLENLDPGPFLNKVGFEAKPGTMYRFRLFRSSKKLIKLWNLGFYRPSTKVKNDYWIAIGASIQNQSMRHSIFNPEIRRLVPGANPILFNLAVKGWVVEDILAALPAMFESHPYAGYVLVHIGGNNISRSRPYPGGAEELQKSLKKLMEAIVAAGKVPVLSRISYRKYSGPIPVPPESNGSGPYASQIYDPLIAQYSPDFYDWNKKRGKIDFYQFIKNNPKFLSDDGVHLSLRGEPKWCAYWAKSLARTVYFPEENYDYIGPVSLFANSNKKNPIKFQFRKLSNAPEYSQIKILDKTRRTIHRIALQGEKTDVVLWDLKDSRGAAAPPGIYYYQISLGRKKYSGQILFAQ